jgi:hypothetical protein
MKRLFFPILLFAFFPFIYSSCSDEPLEIITPDSEDNALLLEAKDWVNKDGGIKYFNWDETSRSTAKSINYFDNVNWNTFRGFEIRGKQALEVNLNSKEILVPNTFIEQVKNDIEGRLIQNLLLVKEEDGFNAIIVRVLEYSTPPSKGLSNQFKRLDIQKLPKDFHGELAFYTMNDQLIYGYSIKNGNAVNKFYPAGSKIKGGNQRGGGCDFIYIEGYTYVNPIGPGEYDMELIYEGGQWISVCTAQDELEVSIPEIIDGGSGGGGGETSGGEVECFTPHPYFEDVLVPCDEELECLDCIENQLKDPCLKNTADKVLSQDLNNLFSNLIQETFNSNEKVNLLLKENDLSNENAHGSTSKVYYHNGKLFVDITLDPKSFKGVSQEFIASTILHECFHALIFFITFNNSNYSQHESLFTVYLDLVANSLFEAFPNISLEEAKGLLLKGALALESRGIWSSSYLDEILNYSNFSRNQIEIIKHKHLTLISGTQCK